VTSTFGDPGGGAIHASGGTVTVMNCTIYNNSTDGSGPDEPHGGGIYLVSNADLTVTNSIIWGNSPNGIEASSSSWSGTYSDIQGGPWNPIYNNLSEDPDFVGGSPFDLHLTSGSPCLDTGTSENAPSEDFDGDSRPQGENYDRGAYEQ
jgi:hypothetical protein